MNRYKRFIRAVLAIVAVVVLAFGSVIYLLISTGIRDGRPMTKTLTVCKLEATPTHEGLFFQIIAADADDGTLHELQLSANRIVVAASRELRPDTTFRVTFRHRADWESNYGAEVTKIVRDDTVHTDCGVGSPPG